VPRLEPLSATDKSKSTHGIEIKAKDDIRQSFYQGGLRSSKEPNFYDEINKMEEPESDQEKFSPDRERASSNRVIRCWVYNLFSKIIL
jgi:hypothetical protein